MNPPPLGELLQMVWKNICDPAVAQELDTPGLTYLACIHSFEVVRTSTH